MIITTKKIDVVKISAKNLPENLKFLQFDDYKINTSDKTKKAVFRYTETAFNWEDFQSQEVIDGVPQLNEDGTPKMVTLQRKIDKEIKYRNEEFDYDTFFNIRNQIRASLPEGLTDAQQWAAINEQGLVAMIVQGGFYKGQFLMSDFEFVADEAPINDIPEEPII